MSLRAGVGKSTNRRADLAGAEAASAALASLAAPPVLVLVFATTGYDQAALLAAVRSQTGAAPLAGCSGTGLISREGSDESSHVVGVLALGGEGVRARTAWAREASTRAREKGRALADQLRADASEEARLVLLFTDGLTVPATELLGGLRERLGLPCAVVGGAAGDAFTLDRTYQYRDGQVASDAAVAVLLSGAVRAQIAVSHGCDAFGLEQTITRAEGSWVHEIDGQPAWSFFKEYLGDEDAGLDALKVAYLCLAERLPAALQEEYGEFIIRVPLELKQETGALFFPGGLAEGTKVHLALRNAERIRTRAVASARTLVERTGGAPPAAMLQFDCVGRGQLLFGERTTEQLIHPVQRLFTPSLPWLGLHTYGEIAPLGGEPYFHNFTVAFCALYPEPAS